MNRPVMLLLTLVLLSGASKLSAQGTAFNYQGRLSDAGSPANGKYDLRFVVFNAVTNGNQASISLTNFNVPVSNGLFNATLDFGSGLFTGTNYWLDIAVRATNVTTIFTPLVPRQPILPVPYAIFANSASNVLGNLSATQLTGTVPSAQIAGTYSGAVNFANGANTFSGTFSGNGSGLTSLNGSQVTTGTIADAQLTTNVALLNRNQTYSGANNLTNWGNNFVGSFFGNGLVGWVPVFGNSLQAEIDHGYLLTSSQFTTVTLPTDTNIGYIVRISGAGSGGWRVGQGTSQSIIGNFISYKNSTWVQAAADIGTWKCLASSANGSLMYAGAASLTGIYQSTDYGHTWGSKPATGNGWYGVACSADGSKVYAVPQGGNIQYSYDAGSTWFGVAGSAFNWIGITSSADGNRLLAVAQGGLLYISTNSAVTWFINLAGNKNWTSVASSANGTNLVATIGGGGICSSTNGGATWTTNNTFTANWTAVAVSADGSRMAAAAFNNTIYVSTNSGNSWSKSGAATNNWTCLTASADCNRLVAGISNSIIYASVNFGATWTPLGSPTNQIWRALAGSADGSQLTAGVDNGNIYYSGSSAQITTLTSTNGFLSGSQGTAVELQHIGNGRFMPVSAAGELWAN